MLIPLGFLAASGVSAGSFDLLETQTLTGSQASVTFSSLSTYASTYQHLQLRMTARSTRADTADSYRIQFNGDTAGNYSFHQLDGTGSSVGSAGTSNVTYMQFGAGVPAANATASSFSGSVIDILDPYETTKFKTIRGLAGWTGGFQIIELTSGNWRNTNALTSILIYAAAGNLAQYSRFSLYGIKAS